MAQNARHRSVRFSETPIAGAVIIDLDPISDDRGFFARTWDNTEMVAHGIDPSIAQMNISKTFSAGTFRGFHWNPAPHTEAKTVRCVAGAVFDVIVDMRQHSPTYLQSFGVDLSATNHRMLHVPHEVANGFLITADDTTLLYTTTTPHEPGAERGCRFDDPLLSVDWPLAITTVSAKDSAWPDLAKAPR